MEDIKELKRLYVNLKFFQDFNILEEEEKLELLEVERIFNLLGIDPTEFYKPCKA